MHTELYITYEQLQEMITDSVQLGITKYQATQKPKNDLLSRNKAYQMYGFKVINNLIDNHIIKTLRSGEFKNSKVLVSKAEIDTAIYSSKLLKIITINRLNKNCKK
ncbi:MAG: hypothetical protein N4A37_05625 [Prolixibacteraceae bacterium]|jgi:hypothetical protein|nr:hypothetical protein [Prolixibacteraceae bacterium]